MPCIYFKNYNTTTFIILSDVFALVEQKLKKNQIKVFLCKPEMTMVGYSFLLRISRSYFTFSLVIPQRVGDLLVFFPTCSN